METGPLPEAVETFDSVSTKVYQEERRLQNMKNQNSQLIPIKSKKTQCSLPINNQAIKYFKQNSNLISLSFENYIQERRESESSTLVTLQQCSQFISYLQMTLKNKEMSPSQLLFHVAVENPLLFHQYFQYLRDHGLKCSTILVRVNSLYHLIQWMRMTQMEHFQELTQVLDRIAIDRIRYNAITSMDQKKKTVENLIENRQWVEGGLPTLQTLLKDSWSYYEALVALSKYQMLKNQQYSWALGFTLSTLWVYGINARSQTIEKMTLKDFKEMEANRFFLSTNFKTVSTYGYQVVSPTDVLKIYVKYIRKQIINEEIDSDQAALFPTTNKTFLSAGEVSKKINLVFKKYGYDLTVTKLRDMLSTHVEELHQEGKITNTGKLVILSTKIHFTPEYQQMVTTGQTHSVPTHLKFYVYKKRKLEEAIQNEKVFERHLNEHPLPVTPILDEDNTSLIETMSCQDSITANFDTPFDETISAQDPIRTTFSTSLDPSVIQDINQTYDFGTSRPDLLKKGSRFEWTNNEISHLQYFILNVEPTLSESERKNKYSSCLNYLRRADPNIQKDFHPFHCENSGRIKTGYETALKRLG